MSLSGKTFALSGAASGIGLTTATLLVTMGASSLSICDLNDALFPSVHKTLLSLNPSLKLLTTKVDATDSQAVDAWIQNTVHEFGQLDGCVNCIGTINFSTTDEKPLLLSETDETWRRVWGLNVDSVFFCMRAQVRAMTQLRKKSDLDASNGTSNGTSNGNSNGHDHSNSEPSTNGNNTNNITATNGSTNTTSTSRHPSHIPTPTYSIVNIASAASLVHDPTILSYSVSKRALVDLTTTLAADLRSSGIRVNCVSPSATRTGMALRWYANEEECERDMAARGIELLEPERVAETIVWLLGEGSERVSGQNIAVGASAP